MEHVPLARLHLRLLSRRTLNVSAVEKYRKVFVEEASVYALCDADEWGCLVTGFPASWRLRLNVKRTAGQEPAGVCCAG